MHVCMYVCMFGQRFRSFDFLYDYAATDAFVCWCFYCFSFFMIEGRLLSSPCFCLNLSLALFPSFFTANLFTLLCHVSLLTVLHALRLRLTNYVRANYMCAKLCSFWKLAICTVVVYVLSIHFPLLPSRHTLLIYYIQADRQRGTHAKLINMRLLLLLFCSFCTPFKSPQQQQQQQRNTHNEAIKANETSKKVQ